MITFIFPSTQRHINFNLSFNLSTNISAQSSPSDVVYAQEQAVHSRHQTAHPETHSAHAPGRHTHDHDHDHDPDPACSSSGHTTGYQAASRPCGSLAGIPASARRSRGLLMCGGREGCVIVRLQPGLLLRRSSRRAGSWSRGFRRRGRPLLLLLWERRRGYLYWLQRRRLLWRCSCWLSCCSCGPCRQRTWWIRGQSICRIEFVGDRVGKGSWCRSLRYVGRGLRA